MPDGRSGLVNLEKTLVGVDGLEFVHLDGSDVVRHRIVADIVAAYERSGGQSSRPQVRGGTRRRDDSGG